MICRAAGAERSAVQMLAGLFPYAWAAALAAGAAAGYLGVAAGRWMRPSTLARPAGGEAPAKREARFERARARVPAGVATLALCAAAGLASQAAGHSGSTQSAAGRAGHGPGAHGADPGRPAPRGAGDPARHGLRGRPQGHAGDPLGREGRGHVREPLHRVGADSFEARFSFPGAGHWRTGPFFYLRETRWTERVRIEVSEDAPADTRRSHTYELELAAEANPVNAPTWLKPIVFALLAGVFGAALWLVVVQLRILRDGGIGPLETILD
jgi:hypothetical protein